MLVQELRHFLVEKLRNCLLRRKEHVVDRDHCLNEGMLFPRELLNGGLHHKLAVSLLDPEASEHYIQQLPPSGRFDRAARRFQIAQNIAVIGETKPALVFST